MCVWGKIEKFGDHMEELIRSRGWGTVPLFSNLAKTTYGFGEWPMAMGE